LRFHLLIYCLFGSQRRISFQIWMMLAVSLLIAPTCQAQQDNICSDNSYIENLYPGSIFVSDTAVMYSYSNCPSTNSRLDQQVRLQLGSSLYFWFRLQGDRAYLNTDQSSEPFRLNFYRDNGFTSVLQGSLYMGYLDKPAVVQETLIANGLFDWRVYAEKWIFSIPGHYQITLSQGQTALSCARSGLSCSWEIEVVP
jgi:hypothetical protein